MPDNYFLLYIRSGKEADLLLRIIKEWIHTEKAIKFGVDLDEFEISNELKIAEKILKRIAGKIERKIERETKRL